jgi:hypothetical protein
MPADVPDFIKGLRNAILICAVFWAILFWALLR